MKPVRAWRRAEGRKRPAGATPANAPEAAGGPESAAGPESVPGGPSGPGPATAPEPGAAPATGAVSGPASAPGSVSAATAAPARSRAGRWGLLPLLTATVTTTMANTVVNVPMTSILADLDAPLSRGVLVATAFPVTLAALMPVSGWLGDRFGHRRVLCWAMTGVLAGSAGAALAPSLPVLVAFRMLQGLAAAPVLPVVMVLVVQVLGEGRRGRALSLWAAANGAGQALGPTTGGLLWKPPRRRPRGSASGRPSASPTTAPTRSPCTA